MGASASMRTLIVASMSVFVVLSFVETSSAQQCGDVNLSGSVTANDALLVLRRSVGQDADLTCSATPTGLMRYDASRMQPGVTLYASFSAATAYLLDVDGQILHSWVSPDPNFELDQLLKPLPNGNLLAFLRRPITQVKGRRKLIELDWDGNVVWQYPAAPNDFPFLHHDFERLANGNTLLLTAEKVVFPDIRAERIDENIIFEIDPDGNVVWSWSTLEHYDQFAIPPLGRRQIATIKREDVFHTNSIQSLPPNSVSDPCFAPGNVLVSQRTTNLIFVIEKATGDICWQMQLTIGQHHARMIPPGLPGAGNILVFDNGGVGGYPEKRRFHSAVKEIDPATNAVVWSYTATNSLLPQKSFFSFTRGSAQRLQNGNTLIVEAEKGRIFEVTAEGDIVFEYIDGNFDTLGDVWDYMNLVYRAYRIDYSWLDGALAEPFIW